MLTPNHVNQYFGNKKESLKFGCKTLFLLNVSSQMEFILTSLDYTQVSLYWAMKLFTTLTYFYSRIAANRIVIGIF